MAVVLGAVMEIMRQPTIGGVLSGLALFSLPLWLAALLGVLVGWAWKPSWAVELVGGDWNLSSLKPLIPAIILPWISSSETISKFEAQKLAAKSSEADENGNLAVMNADLKHLYELVEGTDGGPTWHQMMNKVLPSFSYQAWRRDPENGPPEYRSRTIVEDATAEIVRDFFWDDEFRMKSKWDDMLIHHATLEECLTTGTMVVHWIRKFPFFCSDREYTIGRRIWRCGQTYYCVTKGIPCSSIPRSNKPRRVDVYYSSWCIRPAESRRGDGQMTACEVLLFHHEDMGIPWEIAKLGIRQGMWGCVKRIEPGLRAYQRKRFSNELLSKSTKMAQINTEINNGYLRSLEINAESSDLVEEAGKEKQWGRVPKVLVVGGAVVLACSLDRGLLTKAIIFGVARRFMKQGRRI